MIAAAPARCVPDEPEAPDVARGDLREDFGELLHLHRSLGARLEAMPIGPRVREERARHAALDRRLANARARERRSLPALRAARAELAGLVREEHAVFAALATAPEWQSPPFVHSTRRLAGDVVPHWNDYRRDRHLDAEDYERAYLAEVAPGVRGLRALLTSCGMAAFTTILGTLVLEGRLDGPVVAGRGLYHETRDLLRATLRDRLHEVDEEDPGAVVRAIRALRPRAAFFDSACQTRAAAVPDLGSIAGELGRLPGRPWLVVDNTALSVSFDPFALPGGARVLVWESLLKYAQFGLDRVNAGIVVAPAQEAERLDRHREHLGTNVADIAVHALPRPDRALLARRLARLGRNALLLAERLKAEGVGRVVHPALAGHPSRARARRLAFCGSCVALVLSGREEAFAEAAFGEARRRHVPLIGGSSFGFDTTRLYETGATAAGEAPFLRIAAGTEDRVAIEDVANVLASALREVAR